MAHITSFAITGLVGRKDLYTQILNRDVNVFFGLNGSGKTSLLKILNSAMANDATSIQEVAFAQAEVTIYSIKFDRDITRVIARNTTEERSQRTLDSQVFPEPRANAAKKPPMVWKTVTESPTPSGNLAHRYLPTARLYSDARALVALSSRHFHMAATNPAQLGAESERLFEQQFVSLVVDLWAKYAAEIGATVREAQADGLANILRAVIAGEHGSPKASNLDVETSYLRVRRFLKRQGSANLIRSAGQFAERLASDATLLRVVSDIDAVERRVEEANQPAQRLRELIAEMFSGGKEVVFGETGTIDVLVDDRKKIPLESLSSGEKQVMRIFLETLLAGAHSFIIDEPELSMHVDWQRRLIRDMRTLNPNAQLIMATHSPEIMAEIADTKIFRV